MSRLLRYTLDEATHESVLKQLKDARFQREYQGALAVLERIPQEIISAYRFASHDPSVQKEKVL